MASVKADISQEHDLMNVNSSNPSLNVDNSRGNIDQHKVSQPDSAEVASINDYIGLESINLR